MKKRILASMLTAAMLIGVMPIESYAYEEAAVVAESTAEDVQTIYDCESSEMVLGDDSEIDVPIADESGEPLYEETIYEGSEEDELLLEELEETDASAFQVTALVNDQVFRTYTSTQDGKDYLFLPMMSASEIELHYSGTILEADTGTLDTEAKTLILDKSEKTEVTFTGKNDVQYKVTVMCSTLPSVQITLNNTTLDRVHMDKNIKYPGNSLVMTTEGGAYNLNESDVEFKGRGNSTWKMAKRSYQFKLSSKKNVLGMGKAKTWILLANHADATLMRNKLMFDLADSIGLEYTSNAEWVDLWIDGSYLGNYLLCEKVQVGSNRVELSDGKGVLAELDNNYYAEEANYFKANSSGTYFTLKDSVADDEGTAGSVAESAFSDLQEYISIFESFLYSTEKDWESISSMIDVDSFVRYYLVEEFSENSDACRSSAYFYKDGDDDVLHAGPVWDFDLSLGSCHKDEWGGNTNVDYLTNIKQYMSATRMKYCDWFAQLFTIPEFQNRVVEIYQQDVKGKLAVLSDYAASHEQSLGQSAEMNFIRWDILGGENLFGNNRAHSYGDTYEEECDLLRSWIEERAAYMDKRYSMDGSIATLKYRVDVQSKGWTAWVQEGETAGITGKSLAVKNLEISVEGYNPVLTGENAVQYKLYSVLDEWTDWTSSGNSIDVNGQIEAFAIMLSEEAAEKCDVYYRAYMQTYGWMDWTCNGAPAGSVGIGKRLEALEIKLVPKGEFQPDSTAWSFLSGSKDVSYTTHVQSQGWTTVKADGAISGTVGSGKRLEAIKISLTDPDMEGSIEYRTHVQSYGWMEWVGDGEMSGTSGQGKRLEAIEIRLSGAVAERYDVYYRVHVQSFGWLDWASNGQSAGSEGYGKRLEAIQIKLVPKGGAAPGKTICAFKYPRITYQTHVQSYGWQSYVKEGLMSGTSGQGKRLEAIRIKKLDTSVEGSIEYQTHVQSYGWMNWVKDGALSGTSGQAKRLEAIRIRLTGEMAEKYDIYYRVHAQTYGWLGWAKNGSAAGTQGYGKRLEAIEIVLVEKGGTAPGTSANAFIRKQTQ